MKPNLNPHFTFVNQRQERHGILVKMWKFVAKRRKLEENLTQLQAKLQNSKAEFQNWKDEKVYSSLLSLFEALKDYQSTESSQLNHIDEARLLSREKLEYLIMNDFNKLFKHISQHFYPDFKMENSPALPFVFHIIDWLALNAQEMHIILSDLLENENVMEGLDWYISSQIIFKRGYIEIFKTDNIQIHLLEHEELRGIRNLLNFLKRNHWKKLELGFISAHLNPSLNNMINNSIMDWKTADRLDRILESIEESKSFNHNWLKVLNMDLESISIPVFFAEKAVIFHTLMYCQKYFEDFNIDQLMRRKVEYFKRSFNLFGKQLEIYQELKNLDNFSSIRLSEKLSAINHILGLMTLEKNGKNPRSIVLVGNSEIGFTTTIENIDKYWISRYMDQCRQLTTAQEKVGELYTPKWISSNDKEFSTWLETSQLQYFNSEIIELTNVFMGLESFLKAD
ncbi:expressed protein [Phakopsora pachyrhizi]|uniref:Expressed protein n=1 Tax=Phakopsora pachyrhizi TaxID=170000 RepID=A0AAV0BE54_PHAPC|nr:expressed protein [Phakopsora pachyrhizi]